MGKTVIVSTNSHELVDIESISSIKEYDWDNVDCLVYNNSYDTDIDLGVTLSYVKGVVPKIIYISKTINPLLYCIFTGLDADIYDSEDYLNDAEILKFLIDNYKNTGMTLKSADADIETLAKCVASLSSDNIENLKKLVSNSFWLKTLNTAVCNVDNALARASKINIDVVEMLSETSNLISILEASHNDTAYELSKLKSLVVDLEKKERPNSPFIFSTYSVPKMVKKVLNIKVVGNCRFLTSFLLAYQHYLKMSKQKSSRLLLILPKHKLVMQRYKELPRLAPDSVELINIDSTLYTTYEPKKIVLDAFFKNQVDLFIVVDLLMHDNIVEGHMVETFSAGSGVGDIEKFNLKVDRTILPLQGKRGNLILPFIPQYYTANEPSRNTLYFDKCVGLYNVINKVLFKEA